MKNKDLKIDWAKDTRDQGDHLNHQGAIKVSRYLGKYLKDNYHLNDYRNNNLNQSYQEAYLRYYKMVD